MGVEDGGWNTPPLQPSSPSARDATARSRTVTFRPRGVSSASRLNPFVPGGGWQSGRRATGARRPGWCVRLPVVPTGGRGSVAQQDAAGLDAALDAHRRSPCEEGKKEGVAGGNRPAASTMHPQVRRAPPGRPQPYPICRETCDTRPGLDSFVSHRRAPQASEQPRRPLRAVPGRPTRKIPFIFNLLHHPNVLTEFASDSRHPLAHQGAHSRRPGTMEVMERSGSVSDNTRSASKHRPPVQRNPAGVARRDSGPADGVFRKPVRRLEVRAIRSAARRGAGFATSGPGGAPCGEHGPHPPTERRDARRGIGAAACSRPWK
jgi:hypothetical protein